MTHDEDDFGLSDSDEAELLSIETSNLKRKSEEQPHGEAKRTRIDPTEVLTTAKEVLKKSFRLDAFRLKQEAVILRLLEGESAVVVFPTGKTIASSFTLTPRLILRNRRREIAMLPIARLVLQSNRQIPGGPPRPR